MARASRPRLMGRVVVLAGMTGLCLAGCGAGKVVRVQGKVTLDGKPLPRGVVIFHPDAGKGNSSPYEVRGEIRPDSSYELGTNQQLGVAPGWYRVSVIAQSLRPSRRGIHSPPRTLIDPRYGNPATSGLALEVAPGRPAGAYDLALQTPRQR